MGSRGVNINTAVLRHRQRYSPISLSPTLRREKTARGRGLTILLVTPYCPHAHEGSDGEERMRWLRRDVSGLYLASGELLSCRRVRFHGCKPPSSQPPSRKFCLKWLTATTPTFRGSLAGTSLMRSSLAFATSFCRSLSYIGLT